MSAILPQTKPQDKPTTASAAPATTPAPPQAAAPAKALRLTIDGREVEAYEGETVLDAARRAGRDIPTLCYHPAVGRIGSCRVCVVEIEGARTLPASCVTPVADGMVVHTNTPAVREARRTVLELLLAAHPHDCLKCERNGRCELQDLAMRLGIRNARFRREKVHSEPDASSAALVREPDKCVLCGRCVKVCNEVQAVGVLGFAYRGTRSCVTPMFEHGLAESKCVSCGQCAKVCPVGAISEKEEWERVLDAIADSDLHVVVQVAPAVRAAIGEEFGIPAGTAVTGKLATALHRLGFDAVFDTQFAADLTIMEEGHELLERIKSRGKLPLITSCSPGWVRFCETFFPDFLGNVSSCKSPQQMMGAVIKTYYARKAGVAPERVFSVSVMPCTAKKYEAARPEMNASGVRDVDVAITTRELARMIKAAGIDFANLPDGEFDAPLGISTGAGTIFGATGGVMEAALRTVSEVAAKKPAGKVEFAEVRGLEGIREATVDVGGQGVRIAVASGLANAARLLQRIREGKASYHFVEIMACPGGCVEGGGQPRSCDPEIAAKRAAALYAEDGHMKVRKSHENLAVRRLYDEFLGKPGSEVAHRLLHTTYRSAEEAAPATGARKEAI
ncbi:MAG: NADH-dependent [FeFe] hydrogenase, group A6 [Bacillota bacterium]|nr:NADH-dependent [FeFe] hydrogenase, group A6 [Bacillota bacterium]